MDHVVSDSTLFATAKKAGGERDLRNRRTHQLEVQGSIVDEQLQLDWTYSSSLHSRATIEELAGDCLLRLRAIIRHCQSQQIRAYTPSDFPNVDLSQQDVDELLAMFGEVSEED
jgi:non-ribosomal peptide synthase protein (TIGR01720 family)